MANEPKHDENDLAYPVLMVGEDHFVVLKDAESLTTCSITAFEKEIYHNAIFIDASGTRFRASSVEKKRYAQPFFGFRLMTGRQITVALRFLKIGVLSLAEVIDVVRDAGSRADWGADPEFLSMTARSAKTIGDLFQGLNKRILLTNGIQQRLSRPPRYT